MGREKGAVTLWDKAQGTGFTLRAFEDRFPQTAQGNLEAEPAFVDAEGGDFRLLAGSPCIDAGRPLTVARSAGEGSVIEVEDARFFTDGFSLVSPDVLRVGKERVKALKVDYEANAITISARLSWKRGESVTLDYPGKAPDIGAFEFEAE